MNLNQTDLKIKNEVFLNYYHSILLFQRNISSYLSWIYTNIGVTISISIEVEFY